jgi:tetratricopeptide (TPR) repeat protein
MNTTESQEKPGREDQRSHQASATAGAVWAMRHKVFVFSMVFAFIVAGCSSQSQSLEKAQMLLRFNLMNEGKNELINLLFSNAKADDKAESLYLLGMIAFSENKINQALDTWKDLIAKYPNSKQAKNVQDRIAELSQVVTESVDASVDNAIAQLYLSHADFWSRGKDNVFSIDTSWIPNEDAAIKWYDKIIGEFPKSDAAHRAFRDKMRTLLGWGGRNIYDSKYGIKKSFATYMPKLLETFAEFEKTFPEDSLLQPFRYQIAQAYWNNRNWTETRKWLTTIIEKSSESDDFYKDLAQRRLAKVEY